MKKIGAITERYTEGFKDVDEANYVISSVVREIETTLVDGGELLQALLFGAHFQPEILMSILRGVVLANGGALPESEVEKER